MCAEKKEAKEENMDVVIAREKRLAMPIFQMELEVNSFKF